jgi:hypothetical protein
VLSNPDVQVIGSDLSQIQPDGVVPNCSFVVEDAEEDNWAFDFEFDYIHMRMVASCFDDPDKVCRNIFNNLEPGGWVEIHDADARMRSEDGSDEGVSLDLPTPTPVSHYIISDTHLSRNHDPPLVHPCLRRHARRGPGPLQGAPLGDHAHGRGLRRRPPAPSALRLRGVAGGR